MSQPFQPGPVGLFVGYQNAPPSAAVFLGVGVTTPDTEFRPEYGQWHTDYSGTRVASEDVFAGEQAMIFVDLASYLYNVVNALANYPRNAAAFAGGAVIASPDRGNHPFGDRGTLMRTEGQYLTLFLLNSFMLSPTKAAIYAGQPTGYRFPCAKVIQNTLPRKPLESPQPIRLGFHCVEMLSFQNGLPGWFLYDGNVAGLPAMN